VRAARILTIVTAVVLALTGCGSARKHPASPTSAPTAASASSAPSSASSSLPRTTNVPRPDHIVVVVLENRSYAEIVGRPEAPLLNSLEAAGAVFTQSYAVGHPSQPNYLALFSGSTQGITDDSCPRTFATGNLGRSLLDAGQTFAGYSEDLPSIGYAGCTAALYARKHNPWADFANLPASVNKPMSAFPSDLAALPTVSFVIPNLAHDLHDGTLAQADLWLHDHLGGYAAWAPEHNSVLVITNDEDDHSSNNRISTVIVGAHVVPGRYPQHIDHYALLRTLEDAYDLAPLGASARAAPITAIWST
jgi:acid phosphatase